MPLYNLTCTYDDVTETLPIITDGPDTAVTTAADLISELMGDITRGELPAENTVAWRWGFGTIRLTDDDTADVIALFGEQPDGVTSDTVHD